MQYPTTPKGIIMATTKYPEVEVQLSGTDGNVFSILGKVNRALRNAGATPTELDEFMDDATSGDYDHALVTAMRWVAVS